MCSDSFASSSICGRIKMYLSFALNIKIKRGMYKFAAKHDFFHNFSFFSKFSLNMNVEKKQYFQHRSLSVSSLL